MSDRNEVETRPELNAPEGKITVWRGFQGNPEQTE